MNNFELHFPLVQQFLSITLPLFSSSNSISSTTNTSPSLYSNQKSSSNLKLSSNLEMQPIFSFLCQALLQFHIKIYILLVLPIWQMNFWVLVFLLLPRIMTTVSWLSLFLVLSIFFEQIFEIPVKSQFNFAIIPSGFEIIPVYLSILVRLGSDR